MKEIMCVCKRCVSIQFYSIIITYVNIDEIFVVNLFVHKHNTCIANIVYVVVLYYYSYVSCGISHALCAKHVEVIYDII